MRRKSSQSLFTLTLEYPKEITRQVKVRAASLETAEKRALKRNPGALRVRRGSW